MNSTAVSPRSTLEAPPSHIRVSQGWSLIALDLQKEVLQVLWHIGVFSSTLLKYHPSCGHLASSSFSPELDLHWENQVRLKCSTFIFWLDNSWSPIDRSDI